jgi:transcriptional regulator with XRE-family HTH domain
MRNILIAERQSRGWDQRKLAKVIGVTQSQVSQWETRAVRPTVEMMVRWAEALDHELIVVSWTPETRRQAADELSPPGTEADPDVSLA